jgi:hypothetical protein
MQILQALISWILYRLLENGKLLGKEYTLFINLLTN